MFKLVLSVRLLLSLGVVVAVTLMIDVCPAEGGRVRRGFWGRPRVRHPVPAGRVSAENYYNAYYPKYYGGFHARYFDTIGVPGGDVGLRGNGIYMTPW